MGNVLSGKREGIEREGWAGGSRGERQKNRET